MKFREGGRSSPTGQTEPESVFLVGVELLTRAAKRGNQPRVPSSRGADADAPTTSGARQKSTGNVPPSARLARTAAHPHPEYDERLEFSAEESMAELRELTRSAGGSVIAEFLQRRQKPNPATLIGSGKLEELGGAMAFSCSRCRHLRPRTDAVAAAQLGTRAPGAGDRPHPAYPRHLRPPRPHP